MEQHQDDVSCLARQEPIHWHASLTPLCLYRSQVTQMYTQPVSLPTDII